MAILAGIQTASTVASTVGGILGLGHPKDAERRQTADALYQRAINGDIAAEHQLDCLSGSQTYAVEFGATAPPGCGFATESTRQYAKDLLTKLRATRTVASVAGQVASGATQVGVTAQPQIFASTVAANVGQSLGLPSVPSWVWIAVIAGGAFLWLRRG